MGSNSSKGKKHQDTSQYGQIYLQTDKTAYHAGETVTGTIFLNLVSHYPGSQLFLKFKGKEIAHYVGSESDGDHTRDVMYSDKKEVIKQEALVHSWDTLLPGQFSIPFSFLLAPNLPPSFYQQGRRYLASLEYQLEAYLKPHLDKDPKMKYKQPINLRETILPVAGDLPSTVTTPLKTCCCCKQGSNVLEANFEKNYYSPGENAQVTMELDNSGTKLQNRQVVFSLKQRLEIRPKGIRLKFDFVKVKQELPGIMKGSNTNVGTLNVVLPRFPTENDFNKEIDTKNPKTWELVRLKENNDVITSTTQSSLITSSFYLEVSCPMSGCCATLPVAKLPIGIFSPNFQLPNVNAPDNWHPVALDNITLAFTPNENQPLLQGQMTAGQMIQNPVPHPQPQQQLNVEIVQVSSPKNPQSNHASSEYNQNYFQNYHK